MSDIEQITDANIIAACEKRLARFTDLGLSTLAEAKFFRAVRDRLASLTPIQKSEMPALDVLNRFAQWAMTQTPEYIEAVMTTAQTPTQNAVELAALCWGYDGYFDNDEDGNVESQEDTRDLVPIIQYALTAAEQLGFERGKADVVPSGDEKSAEDLASKIKYTIVSIGPQHDPVITIQMTPESLVEIQSALTAARADGERVWFKRCKVYDYRAMIDAAPSPDSKAGDK